MRRALGLAAGGAVAAVGALVVGEYDLKGVTAVVGGLLFGLAVAEAVVWLARSGGTSLALATALLASAGVVWAGWIAVRNRGEVIHPGAWLAAALAALAAGLRVRSAATRGSGSRRAR